MSKYAALRRFFSTQIANELPMSFQEVENIIGAALPSSAHRYPSWWANDLATHVQAKAWLDAGYETQNVDIVAKKLVFKRVSSPRSARAGMSEPQHVFKHGNEPMAATHPMIGALKGLLLIEPDYDLTQPAMPEWAELVKRKYGAEERK
jgi:hypothetical protein